MGTPHRSQCRTSYGARQRMIFSAKQRGGHEESYLGFGRREEAVLRARDTGVTSPDRDVGGGSLRRSPGSQFWSRGFTVRSSSSSYAPIVVRSYESRLHRGIMMLGFLVLRLTIGTYPRLFIEVSSMVS
jgi:hypothetical protein